MICNLGWRKYKLYGYLDLRLLYISKYLVLERMLANCSTDLRLINLRIGGTSNTTTMSQSRYWFTMSRLLIRYSAVIILLLLSPYWLPHGLTCTLQLVAIEYIGIGLKK
jgi:hypothetical protein